MTYRPTLRQALAALVLTLAGATGARIATAPDPGDAATAIMNDGRDVNVIVRGGVGQVYGIDYNRDGHGELLVPVSDLRDKLGGSVGVAPLMGWPLNYMGQVATKARSLRYCSTEARAFDQANGTAIAAASVQAVRDTYDAAFDVLPSVEDCAAPDLVFGANAAQDCGTVQAWGCARLVSGSRTFVRVTVNGDLLRVGRMPASAVYWIQVHEGKHGGDLGHTGTYGGEGRAHSHPSDMGYICQDHPCDNTTGKPAKQDWDDGTGLGNRWGLRPKPSPTPSPTPTPTPTPRPSDCRGGIQIFVPTDNTYSAWNTEDAVLPVGPEGFWVIVKTWKQDVEHVEWNFVHFDGCAQ